METRSSNLNEEIQMPKIQDKTHAYFFPPQGLQYRVPISIHQFSFQSSSKQQSLASYLQLTKRNSNQFPQKIISLLVAILPEKGSPSINLKLRPNTMRELIHF